MTRATDSPASQRRPGRPTMHRGRHTWAPPQRARKGQRPPLRRPQPLSSWVDLAVARPSPGPDDSAADTIGARHAHQTEHGARVRGKTGFTAGGPADVMSPCSVLAELTGQASGRMSELTDDELVGVMRAARRVQSWQVSLELQAVRELAARRLAEPRDPHQAGPRPAEIAGAEVAAALTLTGHTAEDWMTLAGDIDRLQAVRSALAAGQIDLARARTFTAELSLLDTLLANCLATSVMPDAPALTTSQLRARLRRAVLAADPDMIRRRQARAQRDARVEIWGEPSGNAVLAGRELPPAGALAASRHLTALAQALKKASAAGDLDQIRARVYLALLSGRDPATVLHSASSRTARHEESANAPPGQAPQSGAVSPENGAVSCDPAAPGMPRPATDDTPGPATDTPSPGAPSPATSAPSPGTPGPATDTPNPGAPGETARGRPAREAALGAAIEWPSGLRGTIHLTLPLSAFLGQTNRAGQVAGYGPADAWTCRYLADQVAGQPGARYCVTVTTPDGHPLGHACTTTPPPRSATPADGNSPAPTSGSAVSGPAPPPLPSDQPSGGSDAVRASLHPASAENPGAPSADKSSAGRTPAPPLPAAVRDWLGQLTVRWLDRQPGCDHALQTRGYRPSTKLAHLVRVLNPTCTAPGCRRPAHQSDLDHIQPYDKGGITCSCNLHPACRHDHQLKQLPGWRVDMVRPGVFTWRLPHGRSYTTVAEPYPV